MTMEETSKRPPKLPVDDSLSASSASNENDNFIEESLETEMPDVGKTKLLVKAASYCSLTPLIVTALALKFLFRSSGTSRAAVRFWEGVVGVSDFVGALGILFAAFLVWRLYRYLNGFTLQPMQRISVIVLLGAFVVSFVCDLWEMAYDDYDFKIIWGIEAFSTTVLSGALVFAGIMMLKIEARSMGRAMLAAAALTFVVMLFYKGMMKDLHYADSKSDFIFAMLKYLAAWLVSALSLIAVYTSIGKYLGVEFKKED